MARISVGSMSMTWYEWQLTKGFCAWQLNWALRFMSTVCIPIILILDIHNLVYRYKMRLNSWYTKIKFSIFVIIHEIGATPSSSLVLGSFQCRGVLLLWHMVGWASCACSRYRTGGLFFMFFFCFSSHLSYLPFPMPHLFGDSWTYWNIVVSAVIIQR